MFLKVVQQLLDEVVSVGKGFVKAGGSKNSMKAHRESKDNYKDEESMKNGSDITTVERQELHMKEAKLVNMSMLDEVRVFDNFLLFINKILFFKIY